MRAFIVLGVLATQLAAQPVAIEDLETRPCAVEPAGRRKPHRPASPRFGPDVVWDRTTSSPGSFVNSPASERIMDWGDVPNGVLVNGFQYSMLLRGGQTCAFSIRFWVNYDGGDTNDPHNAGCREIYAIHVGPFTPDFTGHFVVDVDLEASPDLPPFLIDGDDLDGDGLTDFGYSYDIEQRGPSGIGPSICGEGPMLPPGSPGATDRCSRFSDAGGGNYVYVADLDFGGAPFAQTALRLYTAGGGADSDGDGVPDVLDNCPLTFNPEQTNRDGDTYGDSCDLCPDDPLTDNSDADGDQVGGGCDNCPLLANPSQADCDNDGIGDACDAACACCAAGCPQPGCDDSGHDADTDGDCDVDLTDLANLLSHFGAIGEPSNAHGNTDGDDDVDLTDLATVLARFGNDCN